MGLGSGGFPQSWVGRVEWPGLKEARNGPRASGRDPPSVEDGGGGSEFLGLRPDLGPADVGAGPGSGTAGDSRAGRSIRLAPGVRL